MAGLDEGQRAWIAEEGLAGAVATVGEASAPTIVRVFGQRESEGGAGVDFCIVRGDAQRTLRNLSQRPVAALNLVCPRTYRSLLFKGPCALLDAPWPDAALEGCMARANVALEHVGMPSDAVQRILSPYEDRSMVTLRLRVEEVFDQSPGPHAGAKL